MRQARLLQLSVVGGLLQWAPLAAVAADEVNTGAGRIEARSQDLLAVGLVRGDKLTLHVSRTIDNSPVHDAVVTVVLRGAAHPATAETDGSYTLQTADLALRGTASVELQIAEGPAQESLKGTLDVNGKASTGQESNSARQLWWWVLNFAVCIGFLWLFSRRKAAAQD